MIYLAKILSFIYKMIFGGKHMSQTEKSRVNRHRSKGNGGRLRTFFAVVLLLIGVVLLALNPIKDYLIKSGTESNQISHFTRDDVLANMNKNVTYDFNDIKEIDAARLVQDKFLNGVNPDDLPVVGGIAIPELGINLPIHMGVSDAGMYLGAGTLRADQEMGKGNYPLASHHGLDKDLLFAPLERAKDGQKIYITDLDKVYEYTIDYVEHVHPTSVHLLDNTQEDIVTLITCDNTVGNRIAVRGTLTDELKIDNASEKILDAFNMPRSVKQ